MLAGMAAETTYVMPGELGQSDLAPLPPLPLPDPQNRVPASSVQNYQNRLFVAQMRRDFPAYTTGDPFAEVDNYTGSVYVAVKAVMRGIASASIKVLRKRPKQAQIQKSVTSTTSMTDPDWLPVEDDHPLARLFKFVNPQDDLISFLSQYVLMLELTGRVFVYAVPNPVGMPVELWVLRTPYVTPAWQVGPNYPFGAWQVQLPQPYLYGFAQSGYVILDARDVLEHREENPRYPLDGYSPLRAGSRELDTLRSVTESRKNTMDRGPSIDSMVAIEGASEEQLLKAQSDFNMRYMGMGRGSRTMFTDGLTRWRAVT